MMMAIWRNIFRRSNDSNIRLRSRAKRYRTPTISACFSTVHLLDTIPKSVSSKHRSAMPAIIINMLLEEYRKFLATKAEKTMMALLTNQGKSTNQKAIKSKNEKTFKFEGRCNHCSKRGHKEDQCWIKHPGLQPENGRKDEKKERPRYSMMATTAGPA